MGTIESQGYWTADWQQLTGPYLRHATPCTRLPRVALPGAAKPIEELDSAISRDVDASSRA